MKIPITISYFTDDDIYRPAAARLEASLDKFGLSHEIICCPARGTWTDNSNYKAEFIQSMLAAYDPLDLIWMDADAEVMQYPELLGKIEGDLATVVNGHGIFDAVIFLRNTPAVMTLIDDWIAENKKNPNEFTAAQINLERVLKNHGDVAFQQLPPEYSFNPDIMDRVDEPVIYQHQASRQGRNLYGVTY